MPVIRTTPLSELMAQRSHHSWAPLVSGAKASMTMTIQAGYSVQLSVSPADDTLSSRELESCVLDLRAELQIGQPTIQLSARRL
jgi:hypothetical protein